MGEIDLTELEFLAYQHLDTCISNGEFDRDTTLAIQKLLSVAVNKKNVIQNGRKIEQAVDSAWEKSNY